MPENPLTQWLTPAEVAGVLRVSARTVQRWVQGGQIVALQSSPGRQHSLTRIAIDDLHRFIRENTQGSLSAELAEWMNRREIERAPDLCPRCARRSIDPASATAWCTVCTTEAQVAAEQRHEREKARQRAWWQSNGQQWREQRRDAAKQEAADG